ncbi:MAG: hypothetical protein KGP01_07115, partial [Actinomycetales bacterium]|nr:hypothetical protein [Actinomycetales bacterium]
MRTGPWRKVVLLGAVVAVAAGTVVFASGDSGTDQVTCRTKAGYLRISNTGECRRSETVFTSFSDMDQRLSALESASGDKDSQIADLSSQVADLQALVADLQTQTAGLRVTTCATFHGDLGAGRDLHGIDFSDCDL